MVNRVNEILDIIQYKKKYTMEDIASEIGVTRQALYDARRKGTSRKILFALENKYSDILKDKVYTTPTISTKTAMNGNGNEPNERLKKENEALKIEVKLLKELIATLLEKR